MGNSSGQKRMVINTRERAVSDDFNRSRDFAAAQLADALHALLDARLGSLTLGNGNTQLTDAAGPIGTPLEAAILDGLMVVAPIGGTELTVTPGTALVVDIDGLAGSPVVTAHSDDDSVAKLVHDPVGVLAGTGVLTFTNNVSGSTRVDVVEVRRQPAVILETDNRDIFDPNTGLFTATSVSKVVTARFEYRIRLGTPGAGLPANEQGWVPIAVIGAPNGALNLDACVIYDVRPLVRDRMGPLTVAVDTMPPYELDASMDVRTGAGERRLTGIYRAAFGGYRAGGQFGWEYAGTRQGWIDVQDAQFLEPGFASVANGLLYLWLAFPGGLPRWVRYTPNAIAPFGGRVPFGMYGVPVISTTGPFFQDGQFPTAALAMPTGSGLTGTSTQLATIACPLVADAGNNRGVILARERRVTMVADLTLPSNGFAVINLAPTAVTATEDQYILLFGTHIPKNAKRVLLRATARFSAAAGTEFSLIRQIMPLDPLVATWDQASFGPMHDMHAVMPAIGTLIDRFAEWVDLPALVPQTAAYAAATGHRIRVAWSNAITKDVGQSLVTILGWGF